MFLQKHLIRERCPKQTGLSILSLVAADLVRHDGSGPQKIAYSVKMVVLTGFHKWRPLVLITHVKVCASLRNKITISYGNVKVIEVVTHLDKPYLYMQMRSDNYYRGICVFSRV